MRLAGEPLKTKEDSSNDGKAKGGKATGGHGKTKEGPPFKESKAKEGPSFSAEARFLMGKASTMLGRFCAWEGGRRLFGGRGSSVLEGTGSKESKAKEGPSFSAEARFLVGKANAVLGQFCIWE
jgi:hypothetical protein